MTMTNMKCDVCQVGDAIGVASTSLPFSCAYCVTCAQHGADPEWMMNYYLFDVANGDPDMIKAGVIHTFKDGQYMSFHEWVKLQPVDVAAIEFQKSRYEKFMGASDGE